MIVDAARTAISSLALDGAPLDRMGWHREDQAWVDAIREDPTSKMMCASPGRVLTSDDGLRWQPSAGVVADPTQAWLFLGRSGDSVHRFALAHRPDHLFDQDPSWQTLRDVAGGLDAIDGNCASTAVALANWHATHPRCSRCGTPTLLESAGWVRRCPADHSQHYPRTDPAVIMAVLDVDDRILLGHSPAWPPNRYSTLAGFVEPGETLENAVRREVMEEVGIPVAEVTYLASQPWPFPASLMIGCEARATAVEITIDEAEVTAAEWFSREGFSDAVSQGRLFFPRTSSISRRLIERWYGGELPNQDVATW